MPLITSARIGKTLDTDQRMKRYLISMAVRVVCFVSGVFAPLPYNIALIVLAAVIPGVAVILANAIDQRRPPVADVAEGVPDRLALGSGEVIRGEVADDEGGAR